MTEEEVRQKMKEAVRSLGQEHLAWLQKPAEERRELLHTSIERLAYADPSVTAVRWEGETCIISHCIQLTCEEYTLHMNETDLP